MEIQWEEHLHSLVGVMVYIVGWIEGFACMVWDLLFGLQRGLLDGYSGCILIF